MPKRGLAVLLAFMLALMLAACGSDSCSNTKGNVASSRKRIWSADTKVGGCVQMGTWRGAPIKWRVLAIEKGRALLISQDILAQRPFHNKNEDTSWAHCTLREWLHHKFPDEAFSSSERDAILLTALSNSDDTESGVASSSDTADHVFLLSVAEVKQYFSDDADRIAEFEYTEKDVEESLALLKSIHRGAKDRDKMLENTEEWIRTRCLWQKQPFAWCLRSSDMQRNYVEQINTKGIICNYHVTGLNGVRPAFWLDTSK